MRLLCRCLLTALMLLPLGALADSTEEIHSKSQAALSRLTELHPEVWDLLRRSEGVLVFPDVVKMGFGVGGQYGDEASEIFSKLESTFAHT